MMNACQAIVKRVFDLIMGTFMLLVLLPLFAVIGVWIKLDSKGTVFFIQERAGKNGVPFSIYKFRTMVENAVQMGDGLYVGQNDPRITKAGNFLRVTSLDELPQLLNIIKGEMSIAGPRPTLLYQVEQYDDFQRRRLAVKPGVTGWAQIHGRNSLSWPERIRHDVWYVEHYSLWLDLVILLRTFKVILKREGLYAEKEKFIIKDAGELDNNKPTFHG